VIKKYKKDFTNDTKKKLHFEAILVFDREALNLMLY